MYIPGITVEVEVAQNKCWLDGFAAGLNNEDNQPSDDVLWWTHWYLGYAAALEICQANHVVLGCEK